MLNRPGNVISIPSAAQIPHKSTSVMKSPSRWKPILPPGFQLEFARRRTPDAVCNVSGNGAYCLYKTEDPQLEQTHGNADAPFLYINPLLRINMQNFPTPTTLGNRVHHGVTLYR